MPCPKQQARPTLQRSRSDLLMPPSARAATPAAPPGAPAAPPGAPAAPPGAPAALPGDDDAEYMVAVHRKQVGADAYFVPWQRSRVALFGVPLLVRAARGASGRRLYAAVWRQLARLLSPPAPAAANHARDCDDSLGNEFPFTLRLVAAAARARRCALCAWPALCRGCAVPPTGAPAPRAPGALLAVDWEPPALHLRYQRARERAWTEHGSLRAAPAERAVDVASCLRAFTTEERLEQRYRCEACNAAMPATKKLQIWRLPPILIIHLKRFQYVNNKWIKSHKVVNFPLEDFDPTPFLASVPQETILRHHELRARRRPSTCADLGDHISETACDHGDHSDDDRTHETSDSIRADERRGSKERKRRETVEVKQRKRLESTSLTNTPVQDDNLVDYHQHHLMPDEDPFDLKYNLYAVVSHTGQLSGGHYVAYARHAAPALDAAAAYLLFYERRGLRAAAYLPAHAASSASSTSPPPAPPDPDDDDRNLCALM